jgi:hypothetical protein
MQASLTGYRRPNKTINRVVLSYDGYNSYLLIVDDKSAKTWVFLTRSKEPLLDIVRIFPRTFGRDICAGGFIRCNQGGELGWSQAFINMTLSEFGYKVDPTGADSPSQN